jgi:hypothetical protein
MNLRFLTLPLLLCLPILTSGQPDSAKSPNMAVSAGFFMGGGSMVGADVEYLFADNRWGVQAGGGLVGFGAGVSYHLKPRIRSSFVSVQYWNTWIGGFTHMSFVAPMFVFRSQYFQAGAGCGIALPVGYFAERGGTPLPLFSIGAYVPFSSKLLTGAPSEETPESRQKNKAVSVGFNMGGGSLLGADVEYLAPGSRWGVQAGAGLSSVSAGVTCHLRPRISSPFASIQYWCWQIWQPGSAVAVVGPLLAYRSPKYFQAGLGFSYALYHGADVYASERFKYYWLFNIGAYFPW